MLLTVAQAAQVLRVRIPTVYRMLDAKILKSRKDPAGRGTWISVETLESFINERQQLKNAEFEEIKGTLYLFNFI
jgi:excisionase family DNA binding protein